MNDADKWSTGFCFFYGANPEESGRGSCCAPEVLEAPGIRGEEGGEKSRRGGCLCPAWAGPVPAQSCNYCLAL